MHRGGGISIAWCYGCGTLRFILVNTIMVKENDDILRERERERGREKTWSFRQNVVVDIKIFLDQVRLRQKYYIRTLRSTRPGFEYIQIRYCNRWN